MARVAVLVDDLMLQSKVVEMLRAAGHDPSLGAGEGPGTEVIVADLDAVDVERIGSAAVPALGFCRHTDTTARERALAAGFARVVPRSRMARDLPQLVDALLDGAD